MDRKCYYAYDKVAGKVWIPGCYSALYGPPCVCRQHKRELAKLYTHSEASKEKKAIRELEIENAQLWRVIRKLIARGIDIRITKTGLELKDPPASPDAR